MALIIIDGPEKAGKSTLISRILKIRPDARVRRWGPVAADTEYLEPLKADVNAGLGLVVWDRSWASESVYARLLNRDRRLGSDPWLGEWLYGRAVQTIGQRYMLLGPSADALAKHRDATDLPVDPGAEREAFWTYGNDYGWKVIENPHDGDDDLAQSMIDEAVERAMAAAVIGVRPPGYAGPVDARVIFVGQARNEASKYPGAWLPFSSLMTIAMARVVPNALECAWTNVLDCPPQALRRATTIVACGRKAEQWARYHVGATSRRIVTVAHPAYAFRFAHPAATKARRQMLNKISHQL